jgi:hypothetical protein
MIDGRAVIVSGENDVWSADLLLRICPFFVRKVRLLASCQLPVNFLAVLRGSVLSLDLYPLWLTSYRHCLYNFRLKFLDQFRGPGSKPEILVRYITLTHLVTI